MPFKHITLILSLAVLWATAAQAQITPSSVTLGPSQQQQFTLSWEQSAPSTGLASTPGSALGAPASVGGAAPAPVGQPQTTWTVVPAQYGTITSTGLFTAASSLPASASAIVYAQVGSSLYEAQVLLSAAPGGSTSSPSPRSLFLYHRASFPSMEGKAPNSSPPSLAAQTSKWPGR